MLFSMRVSMMDEPGALGALASTLGRANANIVTLDVVDRTGGVAVDDLCIEVEDGIALAEGLRRTAEEVRGAVVEAVRPLGAPRITTPMHLAASIAEAAPDLRLEMLLAGLPDAMWASWAVALVKGSPPEVLESSLGAPSMTNVETPWLPLDAPRALAPAPWMPPAWRMGRMSYEMAVAPLESPDRALMIARKFGPAFRPSELEQLGLLARVFSRLSVEARVEPATT